MMDESKKQKIESDVIRIRTNGMRAIAQMWQSERNKLGAASCPSEEERLDSRALDTVIKTAKPLLSLYCLPAKSHRSFALKVVLAYKRQVLQAAKPTAMQILQDEDGLPTVAPQSVDLLSPVQDITGLLKDYVSDAVLGGVARLVKIAIQLYEQNKQTQQNPKKHEKTAVQGQGLSRSRF